MYSNYFTEIIPYTSFNLIYDNESIHLDMKSGEQTLHKFLH